MESKLDLSIIVVRYKVSKELFQLILSIKRQKGNLKLEIIVVDNNVNERIGTELLKRYPDVAYIKNSSNKGFGAAVNLGAGKAKGEYLFVLNPDMVLYSDVISRLMSFIKIKNKVGMVSPSYVLKDGKEPPLQVGTSELTPTRAIFSLSILSQIFPNNSIYRSFYKLSRDREKNLEVDDVPGGAFIVKKSVFDRLGGFDEHFFLYFEEHDLSKRAREAGYKNYILASPKVYHIGGIDSGNLRDTDTFAASRFYYFRKHYGLVPAIVVDAFCSIKAVHLLLSFLLILIFLTLIFILN